MVTLDFETLNDSFELRNLSFRERRAVINLMERYANEKVAIELARYQRVEAALESARLALQEYQEYRRMNTLNFQLEKADSYIKAVQIALTPNSETK